MSWRVSRGFRWPSARSMAARSTRRMSSGRVSPGLSSSACSQCSAAWQAASSWSFRPTASRWSPAWPPRRLSSSPTCLGRVGDLGRGVVARAPRPPAAACGPAFGMMEKLPPSHYRRHPARFSRRLGNETRGATSFISKSGAELGGAQPAAGAGRRRRRNVFGGKADMRGVARDRLDGVALGFTQISECQTKNKVLMQSPPLTGVTPRVTFWKVAAGGRTYTPASAVDPHDRPAARGPGRRHPRGRSARSKARCAPRPPDRAWARCLQQRAALFIEDRALPIGGIQLSRRAPGRDECIASDNPSTYRRPHCRWGSSTRIRLALSALPRATARSRAGSLTGQGNGHFAFIRWRRASSPV